MKLDELIEEPGELDPADKLEWLVEFAAELPELTGDRRLQPLPDSCRVQECQTPVYLWVEQNDGLVHLEADVPRSSPVVRGLVTLLVLGLEGVPVEVAQSLPDDLLGQLGLTAALGMTRQQGFRGMMARLKRSLS